MCRTLWIAIYGLSLAACAGYYERAETLNPIETPSTEVEVLDAPNINHNL
ncbi:MAG: hypothetical protein WAZ18_00845 [Alphaproteobacteria bacterium]